VTFPHVPLYEGVGFTEYLDRWIDMEKPSSERIAVVINWIQGRLDKPHIGVRRETSVGVNYWFGRIPESIEDGTVVVVAYRIEEEMRRVVCDNIASLSLPA